MTAIALLSPQRIFALSTCVFWLESGRICLFLLSTQVPGDLKNTCKELSLANSDLHAVLCFLSNKTLKLVEMYQPINEVNNEKTMRHRTTRNCYTKL